MSQTNPVLKKRNAWQSLIKNNGQWFAAIGDAKRKDAPDEDASVAISPKSTEYTMDVIVTLFMRNEQLTSQSKDLDALTKAISSIAASVHEKILTENEASALVEFLSARFVERRLDSMICRAFTTSQFEEHQLKAVWGASK